MNMANRDTMTAEDALRLSLALVAAVELVIQVGRSASDNDKRNLALAVAMGVLHGCCGPNGDFSSEYRPKEDPTGPLAPAP